MLINEQLKCDVMDRGGSFPRWENPFSRTVALWRATKDAASRVQGRASYLHELVKLATIEIDPGWTLAGNHLPTERQGLPLPDSNDPDDVRLMAQLGVAPEQFADVASAVSQWESGVFPAYDDLPEEDRIGQVDRQSPFNEGRRNGGPDRIPGAVEIHLQHHLAVDHGLPGSV